jgi:hypothetical protein
MSDIDMSSYPHPIPSSAPYEQPPTGHFQPGQQQQLSGQFPQPQLDILAGLLRRMDAQFSIMAEAMKQSRGTAQESSGLKVASPDVFDGTVSKSSAFLNQLSLYFKGKKITSNDDKITITLSYMKGGTVGPWVKDMTERLVTDEELSWATFIKEFKGSSGDPNPAGTARRKMDLLKQGTHTADEYVASFNELKKDTGYNDAALVDKFEKGLNSVLVDKIYSLPDMPTTLKDWIKWTTKLDRQWRQKDAQKKLAVTSIPRQASSGIKPLSKPSLPPPRITQPIPPTKLFQAVSVAN